MTITLPDLTGISLLGIVSLAILLGLIDLAWNVIVAISKHTFSTAEVATFLTSHVLLRIAPILFLAVVGHGVAILGIPPVSAAFAAAIAGVAAYFVETVGSLAAAIQAPPAAPPATPAA